MNDAPNQNLVNAAGPDLNRSDGVPSSIVLDKIYRFKVDKSPIDKELKDRVLTNKKPSKIMLIKDEEAPDSKVQIEGVASPNSEGGADITIQAGIAGGNGDSDLFNVNNFGPLSLKFVGPDGFVFMNAAIEITPDESMKPYKSYVFEDKLLKPDSPSRGIVLQLKKTVVNPGDRNEEVSITPTDGKVSIPDLSDGTWTGTYSANSCDFSPPSLKFLSYRAQKRTTPDKLTINVLEKVPRNCMNDAPNQNLVNAAGADLNRSDYVD